MATTVAHSAYREVHTEDGTTGKVVVTLCFTLADGTDEETAKKLLDCARGTVLEEAAQQYADLIEQHVRDEKDITPAPTQYQCSTVDALNGSTCTLTVSADLPFEVPISIHRGYLGVVENTIGDHARSHVKDPTLSEARKMFDDQQAVPTIHIASFLSGLSPQQILIDRNSDCKLVQEIIREVAPSTPNQYPDLMRYITANPEDTNIQIIIGTAGLAQSMDGTGQYL